MQNEPTEPFEFSTYMTICDGEVHFVTGELQRAGHIKFYVAVYKFTFNFDLRGLFEPEIETGRQIWRPVSISG